MYDEYARQMAAKHPVEYRYFRDLCRKYGASGAIAMCQLSDVDLLVVFPLWATLPEIQS